MATAMDVSCDSGDRESAMAFAMELRRATAALQASIDAARSTDHISLPAGGPTTASDVVDYARRISYTTYAPAGYEPGAPLHGIMPPVPQEEHFGASHLARRTKVHELHLDPAASGTSSPRPRAPRARRDTSRDGRQ